MFIVVKSKNENLNGSRYINTEKVERAWISTKYEKWKTLNIVIDSRPLEFDGEFFYVDDVIKQLNNLLFE